MNSPLQLFPDPDEWQKAFQRWWATGATIVGTLATALGALRIPSPWADGIAVTLAAGGLGVSFLLYRKQVQQQQTRTRIESAVKNEPQQLSTSAAFRGLRRFRAGEQLPGAARRRAAASLLAEVQRPSFELAIVTGDSGAGKSSLLECALVEALESSGYLVQFITDLGARLSLGESTAADESAALAAIWNEIRSEVAVRRADSHKVVVLVLDQFEELLSRLPIVARDSLGGELRKALADGWRIVIGLRKEFLAELKEVAEGLGRPLSLQDTFILRNFKAPEAADVIRECAVRDEITIDDDLPDLIANDLTVDGSVRPPDLQIVCEALQGEMTVDRYRRERRAAGLRSRFINDTVELTGDAVLARAVLRELCDIPNNRKRADPVSAEMIAAKARAGTPGDRATPISVEGVLESLYRSYVVVRVKEYGAALWSLIHDYIVEPIKIATEEQVTRSGAAAAELDYFLGEAAAGRIAAIPLPRLREIREHAPPARLSQDTVRRLIRRSMLLGYGKPAFLVTAIAALSFASVILLAADWDTWRPVGAPLSHWESRGHRDRQSASPSLLHVTPSELLAMKSGTAGRDSRVTVWDTRSGKRLETYSGPVSLSKGAIWAYDRTTGELTRRTIGRSKEGQSQWTQALRAINPPEADLSVVDVIGEPPKRIVFESAMPFHSSDLWRAVLDVTTGAWKLLNQSDVFPAGDEPGSSSWDYADSSELHAVLIGKTKSARLTVFPFDYSRTVIDQQFDTGAVNLLGFLETDGIQYLSVVIDGRIETIPIRSQDSQSTDSSTDSETLQPTLTPLPPELPWKQVREARGKVVRAATQYLFLIPQQTRTVILPFDPVAARFGDPIISSGPTPNFEPDGTLVWSPSANKGTMVWPEGSPAAFFLPHVQVQSTDHIILASKRSRLLLVHDDNSAELWKIDERNNSDQLLAAINVANASQIRMSNDEQLVIARQEGGILYGWSLDGESLGTLGSVGSDVVWTTYNAACKRIFLWTKEGQRLDWRFGTTFPFYGFRPARTCAGTEVSG